MIIKTKLKIGKFIENSRIDNIPIVYVDSNELDGVDEALYEKMEFDYSPYIEHLKKFIPIKAPSGNLFYMDYFYDETESDKKKRIKKEREEKLKRIFNK